MGVYHYFACGWIGHYYVESTVNFTYYGFSESLLRSAMYIHFLRSVGPLFVRCWIPLLPCRAGLFLLHIFAVNPPGNVKTYRCKLLKKRRFMSVSPFAEPSGHTFTVTAVYTASSFVCKGLTDSALTPLVLLSLMSLQTAQFRGDWSATSKYSLAPHLPPLIFLCSVGSRFTRLRLT